MITRVKIFDVKLFFIDKLHDNQLIELFYLQKIS